MRKALFSFLFLWFLLLTPGFGLGLDHEFGGSVRLRYELWDNIVSMGYQNLTKNTNKDRNFFRLRIQAWDKITFNNSTSLYVRLATEPKYHMGPNYLILKDNQERRHFDQDEIFVDNLYIDLKKPFGLPVNFRIGRQDFLGKDMYGEGFLISEGTPNDGSRSFYFNALKATLLFSPKHTVDLVFVSNPQRDVYLPVIHPSYDDGKNINYIEHKKRLTASNERGFWVYGRHTLSEALKVEPYYIYKKEEKSQVISTSSYIHTVGFRAVYKIGSYTLRGEIAKQWGEYHNDTDRSGLGGYVFLTRKFEKCPVKPEVEIGYVYLSGDDPKTKKNEGFNPLFSRAPLWNELLFYTYIYETSSKGGPIPGYWTNLKAPMITVKLQPFTNTEFKISYQKLLADEKATSTPKDMFGNGKNRGDLLALLLSHKFNKNLSGFLQYEVLNPGDFYYDHSLTANFFRVQLLYQF
ncbi:alginate export family protein [Thermodesulfobacterium commune]|jgi:hypothetical protein|uniref:Alginate export domain-containing protein n=1 Tax=Thermodesulfobacterium commune DSM 2178 TaxID=289377 RepID=A0A075WTP7_9BACT|nr:alginate export family protein [Thermodesulfobacterium commune]AIH04639.1 hypothetical protein HL41_08210 [Thermodesulfobacterium commune DSM 2178]